MNGINALSDYFLGGTVKEFTIMRFRMAVMVPALLIVLASSGYAADEAAMADAAHLEHEAQEARARADRAEEEAREAGASARHEEREAKIKADKAAHEAAEAKAKAERLEVEAREARIRAGGE
jgi:hypothetical protein